MHDHNPHLEHPADPSRHPRSLKVAVAVIFAIGGGYYLWMRHQAHVLQYWPLVIFLLCPLMHLFGHGKHGGGQSDGKAGGHHG